MATWVIVVDDETDNLRAAGQILSRNNMRVTALHTGKELIDYVSGNGFPDIVLLDIKMPVTDGFETLEKLRAKEAELGHGEVPVMFLTEDGNDDEMKCGTEMGAVGFVRKPFDPESLVKSINAVAAGLAKTEDGEKEKTDALTGLLVKSSAGVEISKLCAERTGCLMMIDLDSLGEVNERCGNDVGDKVFGVFAQIISELMPDGSRCGRLGSDEFAAFCSGMTDAKQLAEFSEKLNSRMVSDTRPLLGGETDIRPGASIGAVFVPKHGNDYDMLMKFARKALRSLKNSGSGGYLIYRADQYIDENDGFGEADINAISSMLGERSIPNVALQLDRDSFAYVYRYVMRYIIRNQRTACKVLLILSANEGVGEEKYKDLCDEFGSHIRESLRKSDIYMRSRFNRYFIFLTDIREDAIKLVISHLIESWIEKNGEDLSITFETEFVGGANVFDVTHDNDRIVVVDDDASNLKMAGHILSKGGFYVTALRSGQMLLDYVESNIPDLILLDINMPDMDGFETMKRLKKMEREIAEIPVIFLTADESAASESNGLALGAVDFIKKPFVPEVLLLRVRHIVELIRLQRRLSNEVERKTKENKSLFLHVVSSLADAIDAKDTYTNGHSGRVAEYAQEIAKRAGYSMEAQGEIYMMGLLHDVGKIGIPDAVINKPAKLTDEEFELIKNHPVLGARILSNIKEMPKLATGARWHHEKYNGKGYPDGLKGTDIPEEARIIAVADAYDAMTSHRSYRDVLTQAHVREEIEKGKGTQFDPAFAEIMLQMIDEDINYDLREH